jgi:hypothetical protein
LLRQFADFRRLARLSLLWRQRGYAAAKTGALRKNESLLLLPLPQETFSARKPHEAKISASNIVYEIWGVGWNKCSNICSLF